MAFWGIELKPEKPYVHRYSNDQGRLHLSQATLGTGTSTKKSIVQCNVGDKRPIYLCSLLPEKLETCPLNLEFEDDDEVTFSVIGPHSVHLSGFFFGENEDEGDSDGFDGHVIETDSEDDSIEYDSEDEDEYDFIDDDDDNLDMYPSSSVRTSGVKIEEIMDDGNTANENGVARQTKKKKNQTSKSSNNENSDKRIVVKNSSRIPVLESEDEDGFPMSFPKEKNDEDLGSKLTSEETKEENAGEKTHKKKDEDDLDHKKRLKRKIRAVGEDGEQSGGACQPHDPSTQTNDSAPEHETKLKKKNKKKKVTDKEETAQEAAKEVDSGDTQQNIQKEKEKEKKKKKKKSHEDAMGTKAEQTNTGKNGSTMEIDSKVEAKPLQVRSYPNGLVIEELSMGKPDGKKAAPGKKISVHYVGKLKKNGKIFDSNIGRAPFKFRLGIGQVIKGWDVGVNGMRVGDKRRLTVPPAMGYGARGAGAAIPPNSWLVFDVQLEDVR